METFSSQLRCYDKSITHKQFCAVIVGCFTCILKVLYSLNPEVKTFNNLNGNVMEDKNYFPYFPIPFLVIKNIIRTMLQMSKL